jgi:signal transduction histidine kinase
VHLPADPREAGGATAETADLIALTVRDDGRGFTPGAQRGAAQGHFGLTGMWERIEPLNGTVQIESTQGGEPSSTSKCLLRAYDEALA